MKILCVIDNLGSGGAQKQLVGLAKLFKDKGHSVSFLTYHEHDYYKNFLDINGIPYICINEKKYIKRIYRIRKFIRNQKNDVVLSYLEGSNFICEISGFPFRKWKLIVSERSSKPFILKSLKLRFYRFVHIFADYVVANSYANMLIVKKANPFLSNKKCKVIYNQINSELFKEPIEVSEGKQINLIIGASHRYLKNAIGLVKALALLSPDEKELIKVSWYGDKDFDRSYEDAAKFVKENRLEEVIKFYPATISFNEIMQKSDIVGLFSFYEGLPNVICEAMALGKPVIVSNVSDIPVILSHNIEQIFNPNVVPEIAETIKKIINMKKDDLNIIGKKNREIAVLKFDSETIVNQYLELMK